MFRQHANTIKLSLVGLTALLASEAFVPKPYLPNPHDRPTIGYGSTVYPDGTPVKLTDPPVTREVALSLAGKHIEKDEAVFRNTVGDIPLYQHEYDVYIDFMYQYGAAAWRGSGMLRHLKKGEYAEACTYLLQYRKITVRPRNSSLYKFDCSTKGNKICRGVWVRQMERYNKCLAL